MFTGTCLTVGAVLTAIGLYETNAADPPKPSQPDTPVMAATRKKLQTKMKADFKDTRLRDILEELKSQAEGLNFYLATGVSNNMTLTYSTKGEEQTIEQILEGLFKGRELGWIVHRARNAGDRYEGWVQIVQGNNRGYEDGSGEPTKPMATKPMATKPTVTKPMATDTKPATSDDAAEKAAQARLKFAKLFIADGDKANARDYLNDIIKRYPNTKAAAEAKLLLEKLK